MAKEKVAMCVSHPSMLSERRPDELIAKVSGIGLNDAILSTID